MGFIEVTYSGRRPERKAEEMHRLNNGVSAKDMKAGLQNCLGWKEPLKTV